MSPLIFWCRRRYIVILIALCSFCGNRDSFPSRFFSFLTTLACSLNINTITSHFFSLLPTLFNFFPFFFSISHSFSLHDINNFIFLLLYFIHFHSVSFIFIPTSNKSLILTPFHFFPFYSVLVHSTLMTYQKNRVHSNYYD